MLGMLISLIQATAKSSHNCSSTNSNMCQNGVCVRKHLHDYCECFAHFYGEYCQYFVPEFNLLISPKILKSSQSVAAKNRPKIITPRPVRRKKLSISAKNRINRKFRCRVKIRRKITRRRLRSRKGKDLC